MSSIIHNNDNIVIKQQRVSFEEKAKLVTFGLISHDNDNEQYHSCKHDSILLVDEQRSRRTMSRWYQIRGAQRCFCILCIFVLGFLLFLAATVQLNLTRDTFHRSGTNISGFYRAQRGCPRAVLTQCETVIKNIFPIP